MKYFAILMFFLLINCSKKENQHPINHQNIPQENIALLVDNSLTMLAPDFEPNRIMTIKEVIGKVIKNKKKIRLSRLSYLQAILSCSVP